MTQFIANTLPSGVDLRDIVPRNGMAVIALAFLLSTANAEELRPAVHPYMLADVIVVIQPNVNQALSSASAYGREVSGTALVVERGYLDLPIIVPPGMVISELRQNVRVKILLKRSEDGRSYYPIGVFPADYVHGEKR